MVSFVSFTSTTSMCLQSIRDILLWYFWLNLFSPHYRASCLDSISFIIAKFYIIFNLSPHPFPLRFCFVFFSIWLLSLRLNFTLSLVGPNLLFIYSLASIHFQVCFEHINPYFTTLCSQMLIKLCAIDSNFHTFHSRQPQQPLTSCTTC